MYEAGIELWFPTAFYYARDIISPKENSRLVGKMLELRETVPDGSGNWNCDIYTSYESLNLRNVPEFKRLLCALDDHIEQYLARIHALEKLICKEAWFNIAGPKQYQEQHTHSGRKLSLVYYCSVPDGAAPTVFKPIYADNNPIDVSAANNITQTTVSYKAEVGKLVIFPSYVPHLVPQGANTENRITISANYG
tara:strand:- start:81 stop:662 length:582 start_codon:yes stop_codon:yes gene_type:complete